MRCLLNVNSFRLSLTTTWKFPTLEPSLPLSLWPTDPLPLTSNFSYFHTTHVIHYYNLIFKIANKYAVSKWPSDLLHHLLPQLLKLKIRAWKKIEIQLTLQTSCFQILLPREVAYEEPEWPCLSVQVSNHEKLLAQQVNLLIVPDGKTGLFLSPEK